MTEKKPPEFWKYRRYLESPTAHLANSLRSDPYILSWMMAFEPKRILEVGAGSGRASILAARLIPDVKVVALDNDEDNCRVIKEYAEGYKTHIAVIMGDMFRLPFENQSFDICFSVGVLEHFDKVGVLQTLREQLRVAKLILLEVPLAHWFVSERFTSSGDELIMVKAEWIKLLMQVGYILDFSLLGPTQEEIILLAALSDQIGLSLMVGNNLRVTVAGSIEGGNNG